MVEKEREMRSFVVVVEIDNSPKEQIKRFPPC